MALCPVYAVAGHDVLLEKVAGDALADDLEARVAPGDVPYREVAGDDSFRADQSVAEQVLVSSS